MVAKRKNSLWTSGKRTTDWLKIKNWRYVSVIVHTFNKENDYFTGAIYKDNQLMEVTAFKHGLSNEEFQTLAAFFQTKGEKTFDSIWTLPPSICVDIACIDFDGKKLREPRFHSFRFDLTPEECNWKTFQNQLHPIPEQVEITHPDKPVWPKMNLLKVDYLLYLETIAPYLLPFLQNRVLTTIRFPHGVPEEHFYQKMFRIMHRILYKPNGSMILIILFAMTWKPYSGSAINWHWNSISLFRRSIPIVRLKSYSIWIRRR